MGQTRKHLPRNQFVVLQALAESGPFARRTSLQINEVLNLGSSSLYAALEALEGGRLIVGMWDTQSYRRPRKLYYITSSGQVKYNEEFEAMLRVVDR